MVVRTLLPRRNQALVQPRQITSFGDRLYDRVLGPIWSAGALLTQVSEWGFVVRSGDDLGLELCKVDAFPFPRVA